MYSSGFNSVGWTGMDFFLTTSRKVGLEEEEAHFSATPPINLIVILKVKFLPILYFEIGYVSMSGLPSKVNTASSIATNP